MGDDPPAVAGSHGAPVIALRGVTKTFGSGEAAFQGVADFDATVRVCEQRNVAVQTIKALARGPWAAGAARDRETWYQPLENAADIRAAVHWVLARPQLFLNSVGDLNLLPLVLQAADELGPAPQDAAMAKLNKRAGLSSIFGL